LPDGYFVFDRDTIPGLYKSRIHDYQASLVPNTEHDFPHSISISDDGKWVLYTNGYSAVFYLIRANGCGKTIVPVTNAVQWCLTTCGFYRNSPYGSEIFYLASRRQIHAVGVDLSTDPPSFKSDRVLADIGDSLLFNPDPHIQIAVVADQIFCEISPLVNGDLHSRVGYLTIPGGGRGTGGPANVYKWRNDDYKQVDGCGCTMSFDGQYALANAGFIFYGNECIPVSHKGFYITPFRRDTDPPVIFYTENFFIYGTSINWCPLQYRNSDEDFWGWYFSSDRNYVAGRMISTTSNCGAWVVDWPNNVWIPITPLDSNIAILQPAIYFGAVDTGSSYIDPTCTSTVDTINPNLNALDPLYRVVRPNGGEIFHVGQPCTVTVSSVREGRAMLELDIDAGKEQILLPGFLHSINPQTDSIFIFQIPDSLDDFGQMISTISSQCRILIMDYSDHSFRDESDNYFEIRK
jgi:hypothetical protein